MEGEGQSNPYSRWKLREQILEDSQINPSILPWGVGLL